MKIKSLIILAVSALVMTACGNNQNNKAAEETAAPIAITIDSLYVNGEALVGELIEIEGVCSHICSHSASKIFLLGETNPKALRVEAAELGSFAQECVNSVVKVQGMLREERIDEAYLQSWEQRIADKSAEQHGNGEGGCDTEKSARGETANSDEGRIADFRARIAERQQAEGKDYLSFYFVEAEAYEIVE